MKASSAAMHPQPTRDTPPVVVVGAGPVGCVTALELARLGQPSVLLERTLRPPVHPKMDYVSGRSMEFLRRLGLADKVRAAAVDPTVPAQFRWYGAFGEEAIHTWRHPAPAEYALRRDLANPGALESYARIRGSLLESVLREETFRHPLIDLRLGVTVEAIDQDSRGVRLRTTESSGTATVESSFVVACDGARSRVREQAGIAVDTIGEPVRSHSIYFESDDPALTGDGPSFIQIIGGGVTIVSRDGASLWTASFPATPDQTGDPLDLLRRRLDHPLAVRRLLDASTWTGSLSVADRYRDDRVFLAGDSAHHFFPTGGHGANTGIGDGIDIAWKLAAVLDGWGGDRLLDSYELERRPVALFKREMSANLLEVWRRFSRLVAHGTTREVLASFLESEEYQHDNLGLHFGDCYVDSPVVATDLSTPAPASWSWSQVPSGRQPGRRLPLVLDEDSTPLHDRLSARFDLIDSSPDRAGSRLVRTAQDLGFEVGHIPVDSPNTAPDQSLALVRPDQHIAWVGAPDASVWPDVLRRTHGFA